MHVPGTAGVTIVIIVTIWLVACAGALNQELQRAKASQQPVFIANVVASEPNERGMTDVKLQLFNTSAATYKYVDISLIAYNRVGDAIRRTGDLSPIVKLRFTGPLRPRRTPGISIWPGVWHVQKVGCLKVLRIDVTQMDDRVIAVDGAMLPRVLGSEIAKGCAVS